MNLRDHERAALAFEHVSPLKDQPEARAYGAICHHLPVLVHTAGLTAALHFVAGRTKPQQRLVLEHLGAQLHAAGLLPNARPDTLLDECRKAKLARTQGLTQEVQRCLLWYKRFVKSLLRVDAADDVEST